ncbi:hypothetical protein ACFL96_09265 [Thermoproteota archaeon]
MDNGLERLVRTLDKLDKLWLKIERENELAGSFDDSLVNNNLSNLEFDLYYGQVPRFSDDIMAPASSIIISINYAESEANKHMYKIVDKKEHINRSDSEPEDPDGLPGLRSGPVTRINQMPSDEPQESTTIDIQLFRGAVNPSFVRVSGHPEMGFRREVQNALTKMMGWSRIRKFSESIYSREYETVSFRKLRDCAYDILFQSVADVEEGPPQEWTLEAKMSYVSDFLGDLFALKGYKVSEEQLDNIVDKSRVQLKRKKRNASRRLKRAKTRLDKLNKNNFRVDDIDFLHEYVPELVNLDQEIVSLIQTQGERLLFDNLIDEDRFEILCNAWGECSYLELNDIQAYTNHMKRWAEQDDPARVFRRIEAIYTGLKRVFKKTPDLMKIIEQRAQYWAKISDTYATQDIRRADIE